MLLCKKLRTESKGCIICTEFPVGYQQIDIMQIVKDDKLILTYKFASNITSEFV